MLTDNKIPQAGGVWIDAYNQSVNTEVAGTITTRVDSSNHYWVTEPTAKIIPLVPWSRPGKPTDICPTITTSAFEHNNYVMEPQIKQIGSYSPSSACNAKVLDPDGICPTLLNHKGAEPAILTPQRTETAKQLRREGIETFEHRELVPREDGVSNTLTSVQKDNMLLEPQIVQKVGDRGTANYSVKDISNTIPANPMSDRGQLLIEPHGLYVGQSERCFRGLLKGVSRCVTTEGQCAVLEPNQVIGSNQANAYVGSIEGVAPCVNAAAGMGGGHVAMITEEPKIVGYTRDDKGRVESCHFKDTSNTLHTGGGTTAQYVAEQLKEIAQAGRKGEIGVTIHPNGDLRPYRADRADKPTASEFDTKNENNLANTVTSAHGGNVYGETTMYRIRKLTPTETFRLMDVDDSDIEKILAYPYKSYAERETAFEKLSEKDRKRELRKGISKSAAYRLSGNSIVVSCLYHIFRTLLIPHQPENTQKNPTLFD